MIYVTGDKHIPINISSLNITRFPEQSKLTKNDSVIVCGDFGIVWDGSKEDLYWQKWFQNKNFTTLYIDGNHEGFHLLNQYKISEWHGGKVHFINDSIIHLMRGQVYTMDGLKFFTMGGADSIDKDSRIEGKNWWREEMPSHAEFNEAISNLEKSEWKVDYVLTHTVSSSNVKNLGFVEINNPLGRFFDMLEENLKYKHWYFGHFHMDKDIDKKHSVLFNQVIPIGKDMDKK